MIQILFIAMAAGSAVAARGKTEPEKPKTFWQKLEVEEFVILTVFVGLPALTLTAAWVGLCFIIGVLLK